MTIQYAAVPTDPNPITRSRQRTHPARRLPQIITRWRTTVLLLILAGPLSLLLLSVVTYITPSNQYMRPCLPFSIHRISTAAHRTLSCQSLSLGKNNSTMSTSINEADLAGSRLAGFLQSQKELFFGDIENGNGKGWTVAVGNEAGDLDSLVSSIALAYLSSTLTATRTVPMFMTPKSLMHLRPENILALKHANIPSEVLIHPETLPNGLTTQDLTTQGVHFAIVDMNRLLPNFGAGTVDLIIDHHEDEGVHLDAERLIQVPTGSCASLVTKYFRSQWTAATSGPAGKSGSPVPPELASFLLSAMVIDTAGLKSGGKAVGTDYESASFLYPLSTFPASTPDTSDDGDISITSASPVPQALTDFSNQLLEQKFDVSDLSTHDLLLRDYKEYILPTSSTSFPSLQVGLSTVPMALKKSLEKESEGWSSYMKALDGYMHEKNLDVEGVLTTFKTDKKGKHKRELLILVRSGGSIKTSEEAKRVRDELVEGLEASGEILELEVWGEKKSLKLNKNAQEGEELLDSGSGGRWGKVWLQGNDKATRKQVAPLVRDVVAKLV